MRRGPKPAKPKEAKLPVARKSPRDDSRVRDLEKRLAEALRDKAEALGTLPTGGRQLVAAEEQRAAASEILPLIRGLHTVPQPVFGTFLPTAWRLCKAANAAVFLTDGR